MRTHELKCWAVWFDQVWHGRKTFEIRKNDRDFQTGDRIVLNETDKKTGEPSGRKIEFTAGVILYDHPTNPFPGLTDEVCIISITNQVNLKHGLRFRPFTPSERE